MKRGYLVALAGLAIFVTAVVAGSLAELDGSAATAVIFGSFAAMGLCFWIGTAMVAVAKGYHVVVGIVFGAIAPLGLLILTLMPERSSS